MTMVGPGSRTGGSRVGYYLNSFHPLCINKRGRRAVGKYGLPPFQDASCRSEPSFEHPFPGITALCRLDKFAPRLHVGDRIIYITVKGHYGRIPKHWRLIAALEVVEQFHSHHAAAEWYRDCGYPLPRNCMVPGNPPLPLDHTANEKNWPNVKRWDAVYKGRARQLGVFLVCRPLALELYQPKPLHTVDQEAIFGYVRGTRNPPEITQKEFAALLARF